MDHEQQWQDAIDHDRCPMCYLDVAIDDETGDVYHVDVNASCALIDKAANPFNQQA